MSRDIRSPRSIEPAGEEWTDDGLIHFNGIDGRTGQPLVAALSTSDVAALAGLNPPQGGMARWWERLGKVLTKRYLGLPNDVAPGDLAQTGWATVFAADTPVPIRAALQPLLAHRKAAMGSKRYHELEYKPGETLEDWLACRKAYTGEIDPIKLPYYILLVGGPEKIPFEFQYHLDTEYAVGRLAFDTPDQYRCYAESVVAYETMPVPPNAREVVYWAPRGVLDPSTQLSERFLIAPLFEGIPEAADHAALSAPASSLGYRPRRLKGADATKAALAEVLHPPAGAGPALLVTASHGQGLPHGHANQRMEQGALVCQDWRYGTPIQVGHRLTAADVTDDARVHGLVAFLFACYGAGTPDSDKFAMADHPRIDCTATPPFVAALPQRLLAHPRGSSLAVIGHVERAWGFSIKPAGLGPQIGPFRNLIRRILQGDPVGHATKELNEKYSLLSTQLLNLLHAPAGKRLTDRELAGLWIDRNDFQNYILLGDPAVRLRSDLLK
jgi:hypothetical protein